jgi:hypothetical protein
MGQNSLPAFVAGSLASMVGYILLVHAGSDLALEITLIVAGVAAMWTAAVVSEIGVVAAIRQTGVALALIAPTRGRADDQSEPVTSRPTSRRD